MNINNTSEITFDEQDIKDLIKEKLETIGYSVKDIKVIVDKEQWTDGHGLGEIDHERLFLDSIKVIAVYNGAK